MWTSLMLWVIIIATTEASVEYKSQEGGRSCDSPDVSDEERRELCGDPLREEIKTKILKHLERRIPGLGNPAVLRETYAKRGPFPHAVFDDMIPHSILERLGNRRGFKGGQPWNIGGRHLQENDCDAGKGWRCISRKKKGFMKMTLTDELAMHPVAQGVMAALKAPAFVKFLESISGISPLYPDPTNEGGGLHETSRGGALQIHADFRRHPLTGYERRVNAFIYLNDDWNSTWKGDLELWNQDMSKCSKRIPTNFGRFVMFSSHDFSYHGHAEPLDCPPSRSRKSMAFYYYSPVPRPPETIDVRFSANHSTLYQIDRYKEHRCGTCSKQFDRKTSQGSKCPPKRMMWPFFSSRGRRHLRAP